MVKYATTLFFFLLPLVIVAQQSTENWIETEATIVEINNKRRAKSTRSFAIVDYIANDGEAYKSQVELLSIPIFGTTKSVGDTITVLYDPDQPFMVKTPSTSFIETYGMYLLIGAGIILSFSTLKKMWKKNQE